MEGFVNVTGFTLLAFLWLAFAGAFVASFLSRGIR
jgi:hypothetical protein